MAHLIGKDALAAEIDRRIQFFTEESGNSNSDIVIALFGLKSFLDTLEVKEVKEPADVLIEKACDWLTKHAKKYYFNKERYLGTEELVEDFKLSMEI